MSFVLIRTQDRSTTHWQQQLIMVKTKWKQLHNGKIASVATVQPWLPPRAPWHYSSKCLPTFYVYQHNPMHNCSSVSIFHLYQGGFFSLSCSSLLKKFFFFYIYNIPFRKKNDLLSYQLLCLDDLPSFLFFIIWLFKSLKCSCWTYCHGSQFFKVDIFNT